MILPSPNVVINYQMSNKEYKIQLGNNWINCFSLENMDIFLILSINFRLYFLDVSFLLGNIFDWFKSALHYKTYISIKIEGNLFYHNQIIEISCISHCKFVMKLFMCPFTNMKKIFISEIKCGFHFLLYDPPCVIWELYCVTIKITFII